MWHAIGFESGKQSQRKYFEERGEEHRIAIYNLQQNLDSKSTEALVFKSQTLKIHFNLLCI